MRNHEDQDYCRDAGNVYCCNDVIDMSEMETVGQECVQAEGYEHNQVPEEDGEENSEWRHQYHPGELYCRYDMKVSKPVTKVRVPHKPVIPIPNEGAQGIKIPGIGAESPSQYWR